MLRFYQSDFPLLGDSVYSNTGLIDAPLGFQAGDYNLYRYVGNSPTNATDPSGLMNPHSVLAAGFIARQREKWITQVLKDLNVNSSNVRDVYVALELLDTLYSLGTIPWVGLEDLVPDDRSVHKPTRLELDCIRVPTGAKQVDIISDAQTARVNLRINLLQFKKKLVTQIMAMLQKTPPEVMEGDNKNFRVTDRQRHLAVANLFADAYIRAVDRFLKEHPGARAMLDRRPKLLDAIGLSHSKNAPWCADWAEMLRSYMEEELAKKGPLAQLLVVEWMQHVGSDYEHNFIIIRPRGYKPVFLPSLDDVILILDAWRDLLPRAYPPCGDKPWMAPTGAFDRAK